MGEPIDARTAAARLGVDVRTLYAYVSRGALRRVAGPDGRSSRYDSDELELLAGRSRPRTLPRPAASIDLVIATRVSTVTDGLVRYRGIDVLDLVEKREPFEAVADLLWGSGPLPASDPGPVRPPVAASGPVPARGTVRATGPGPGERPGWRLPSGAGATAALVLGALGDEVPVLSRFAALVAATDPGRHAHGGNGGPPDWPDAGRSIIAALVVASGPAPRASAAGGAAARGSTASEPAASAASAGRPTADIAAGLWRRWSPLRPSGPRVRALNTALVLLAEHELALSTLAVRVAASARAAPSACVLAGLGTLSGALHGDVPRSVRERLLSCQPGGGSDEWGGLGFGHPVHRHGDPRAKPLLQAVAAIAAPADRQLIERAVRGAPAPPSVDFALGALCHVARMPPRAATGIFAVARTSGWIAHAAEEYAEPQLRFRGRAVIPARTRRGNGKLD